MEHLDHTDGMHTLSKALGALCDRAKLTRALLDQIKAHLRADEAVLLSTFRRRLVVELALMQSDLPDLPTEYQEPRCLVVKARALKVQDLLRTSEQTQHAYEPFFLSPLKIRGPIFDLLGIVRAAALRSGALRFLRAAASMGTDTLH